MKDRSCLATERILFYFQYELNLDKLRKRRKQVRSHFFAYAKRRYIYVRIALFPCQMFEFVLLDPNKGILPLTVLAFWWIIMYKRESTCSFERFYMYFARWTDAMPVWGWKVSFAIHKCLNNSCIVLSIDLLPAVTLWLHCYESIQKCYVQVNAAGHTCSPAIHLESFPFWNFFRVYVLHWQQI